MIHFVLALVFALIAGFHFYWGFGGKKFTAAVFPEIPNFDFKPNKSATLFVAVAFAAVAFYYFNFPNFLPKWGALVLGVVLIIRAIGEFKYVGFFKSQKAGLFAQYDTKYYSPLCLALGLLSLLIYFK